MVTVRLADFRRRGRDLRKRVGGHDRLGGVEEVAGLRARGQAVHHAVESLRHRAARRSRRSRRGKHRRACSRAAFAAICAVNLHGVAAGLAGEGVGVAGIDHQRPRFAALQIARGTIRPAPTGISSA